MNKVDLVDASLRNELTEGAPGVAVVFTSAKTGEGVNEMFVDLGRAIWRRQLC